MPGYELPNAAVAQDSSRASSAAWTTKWLSAQRFAPYLSACGGCLKDALELYEWNASLSQVLLRDASHFEVALRNAYNSLMEARWKGDEHWLLDEDSPVRRSVMRKAAQGELDINRINRKIIDSARAGLREGFSYGSLVASLTLGFWVHLTDRSREVELWRTNLYLAWPKGTDRRLLQRDLDGILGVRNRVAHHERLFNPRRPELLPSVVDANIVRRLRDLCPEAADYLYGDGPTPVEKFLADNPAPNGISV